MSSVREASSPHLPAPEETPTIWSKESATLRFKEEGRGGEDETLLWWQKIYRAMQEE